MEISSNSSTSTKNGFDISTPGARKASTNVDKEAADVLDAESLEECHARLVSIDRQIAALKGLQDS
eukprot:9919205-Karenia_brevis.AAC.1